MESTISLFPFFSPLTRTWNKSRFPVFRTSSAAFRLPSGSNRKLRPSASTKANDLLLKRGAQNRISQLRLRSTYLNESPRFTLCSSLSKHRKSTRAPRQLPPKLKQASKIKAPSRLVTDIGYLLFHFCFRSTGSVARSALERAIRY